MVAELILPRSGRSELVDDVILAEAMRKGWITPPALRSGTSPPRRPIAPTSVILVSLRADRDAR